LLGRPTPRQLLASLMPLQLSLELEAETIAPHSPKLNVNPQNTQ
jgi:hypothetical protein